MLEIPHYKEVGRSELLEVIYQQSVIHILKENLYFFEYFDGFSERIMLY